MRKFKLTEMNALTQGHTASTPWHWQLDPGRMTLEPTLLTARLDLGFAPRFSSMCKMMKGNAKMRKCWNDN